MRFGVAEPTYFGAHLAQGAPERPGDCTAGIAIIGGGLAGMTLALACQRHGIPARIFEARARGAARQDPRVLALSHGSQQSFAWLGLWPQMAAAATPIATIHISQQGGFGRTRITAEEQRVPALGQVVAAGRIAAVLDDAVTAAGIAYHDQTAIDRVETEAHQLCLRATDGRTFHPRLVVYAEGAIHNNEAHTACTVITREYDQHALICEVSTATPHHGIAYERFTPQGPLALLPCGRNNEYALVYTGAPDEAQGLLALDNSDFLAALQAHFGTRLRFVTTTQRHVFPLGLRYRSSPVGTRCVWLGNAAQTLHPVAGQGFNLALRDIRALAQTLAGHADPGAPALLQRYAAARRIDRAGVIGFTDSVVRLFSNDTPLLRESRGLALLALDLLPPLRGFVARRMMYGLRAGR
ncbi:MAG: 2-octaprenyl-6-methoxyphenol hydroxylase oxidoreductase [Pseudomonadota bacterium]